MLLASALLINQITFIACIVRMSCFEGALSAEVSLGFRRLLVPGHAPSLNRRILLMAIS
jgi:hypothetical protein